ncbi:hypothetical protein [Kitasatospora sp. NPDC057198]|uniref:hypothetical protein n=1 Tax=Kitasatospora sp. NPDC057198 TaxID=3346046 RepID=UPI00363874E0
MSIIKRAAAVAASTAILAGGMVAVAGTASAETSSNGAGLVITSRDGGYDAYYAPGSTTRPGVRFHLLCRDNTHYYDQGLFDAQAGKEYSYFFNVGHGKGCKLQLENAWGGVIAQTGYVA